MQNDHKERTDYAETLYEPAVEDKKCFIKDTKPPVITGHDGRWANPKGGRSAPDHADAPDGISGNWK